MRKRTEGKKLMNTKLCRPAGNPCAKRYWTKWFEGEMTITLLHHSEESSELSGVELNEFKGKVTKTLAGHSVSLERHGKGRKREERSSVSVPDQPASLKRRLMAGLKWFTTTLLELEAIAVFHL